MSASTIAGLRMPEASPLRLGGIGDCWCLTWTDRDVQFACGNDTQGWPHTPRTFFSNRGFLVHGGPEDASFEFLQGYPDHPMYPRKVEPERAAEYTHDYSGFGSIAVDGRIYVFLSTRNGPTEPRFNGAKLIYSDDHGATWHNQDGSSPVVWESWDERSPENHIFLQEQGDGFNVPIVLQMGKDYGANRDGYIYIYSPNGNTDGKMNQIVLCRVPKKALLDRSSYEFFVGHEGNGAPVWSTEIGDRAPVCTCPEGWVLPLQLEPAGESTWRVGVETQSQPHSWTPTVVYNEPLDIYIMANTGMGIGEDGAWFGKPSYLGFWVADEPWGPWTQVHEDAAWCPGGDRRERCYEANIAPKWISADGRSFWLVWTDYMDVEGNTDESEYLEYLQDGTGSDHLLAAAIERRQPYYGFNAQRVELVESSAVS